MAFLPIVSTFSTHILQTFCIPNTPFAAGAHYIHSPEHFIPTHGLCGPGFSLHNTQPPIRLGEYWLVEFTYRTAWDGLMRARIFSNESNSSLFTLSDSKHRPCVMGQMRVRPLRKGFILRCFAQRIREPSVWDTLLVGAKQPSTGLVESMVLSSGRAVLEEKNLKDYRKFVLRK